MGRPGSHTDSQVTPGTMLSGLGPESGEGARTDTLLHIQPCARGFLCIISVHPWLPFEVGMLVSILEMMELRLREVR